MFLALIMKDRSSANPESPQLSFTELQGRVADTKDLC